MMTQQPDLPGRFKYRGCDPSLLGVARYQRQANQFLGVSPDDVTTLTKMGLIEIRDKVLVLTNEGERARLELEAKEK
jgi:hypothetical protein